MPVSKNRGKREKKKPAARRKRAPSSNAPSPAADRRMMEKTMAMLSGTVSPTNANDALEELLQAYRGDYSANWGYSETLLAFRKGDEPGSRRSLATAWLQNVHVPALLIGAMAMPKRTPDYYSPGGRDEAVLYALENRENWAATEGALPWLAQAVQTLPPAKED